ncbi:MAG TPA: hypothetical protein VNC84_08030 [Gammaproteobacteria bacterium]|nr:hypothetical protein [Gammaproteobacteria bacterium]
MDVFTACFSTITFIYEAWGTTVIVVTFNQICLFCSEGALHTLYWAVASVKKLD